MAGSSTPPLNLSRETRFPTNSFLEFACPGQVPQAEHVPSVLGQGQEKVRLLQHMLEGRLLAGPLGPAAQYDFQQLNAVQVSLRSTDLHGGFFHCLLTTGLILCASRLVTLGLAVCPRVSSVLLGCNLGVTG